MRKKVVIIGAGGHAKVIADIIEKSGDEIVGFLDDNKEIGTTIIKEYKVIGDLNNRFAMAVTKENLEFIIAIGDNKKREEISHSPNLKFYTAIHPSAQIGLDVEIKEGTVVMANVCINSSAKIGKHCIINTGAIIEHDNIIEDFVHISPNVALGGTVKIGKNTHVGIGSTIKNNITICENCKIGAGAVVVKDIKEEGTYVGVPAKRMEKI
ncbi:MAG TPA: acetyltransferase [Clostridiaceae bacterium]|nr:acetyltransferase [Clostridiaceae bacterium]